MKARHRERPDAVRLTPPASCVIAFGAGCGIRQPVIVRDTRDRASRAE